MVLPDCLFYFGDQHGSKIKNALYTLERSTIVTCYYADVCDEMREGENGGGAGTRTPDTGIMIPLLYQLSYTALKI